MNKTKNKDIDNNLVEAPTESEKYEDKLFFDKIDSGDDVIKKTEKRVGVPYELSWSKNINDDYINRAIKYNEIKDARKEFKNIDDNELNLYAIGKHPNGDDIKKEVASDELSYRKNNVLDVYPKDEKDFDNFIKNASDIQLGQFALERNNYNTKLANEFANNNDDVNNVDNTSASAYALGKLINGETKKNIEEYSRKKEQSDKIYSEDRFDKVKKELKRRRDTDGDSILKSIEESNKTKYDSNSSLIKWLMTNQSK